jgi:hypothetical protein
MRSLLFDLGLEQDRKYTAADVLPLCKEEWQRSYVRRCLP